MYLSITNFSNVVEWVGGLGISDGILRLFRLVSSCMVLIRQAGLGRFIMQAKRQTSVGTGPIK